MRKLRRHPYSSIRSVVEHARELLRVNELPSDVLYDFKLVAQIEDDWWSIPVTSVKQVRQQWFYSIEFGAAPKIEIDEYGYITCLLLLNEYRETIGFQDCAIEMRDGDQLWEIHFKYNMEHSHHLDRLMGA